MAAQQDGIFKKNEQKRACDAELVSRTAARVRAQREKHIRDITVAEDAQAD